MNYKQMLQLNDVDLSRRGRGGQTDKTISSLRAYALIVLPRRKMDWLSDKMAHAKVKRRVAKRWASRLLREGLPREARLTGHHKRCRWMYRVGRG